MAFASPDIPPITINDIQIEQVNNIRLLGVTISQDLTWQLHIDDITTKASQRVYFIIPRAGIEPHQNIYHDHPFCHRIRLPGVAYQSDNKTNKPARKHSERGHAYYILWNSL
jgi:hypothetical protein